MLGKIISQLYRIADLLKTKKLVDIDSNTDSNSSEDKPKEITIDDVYEYYKNENADIENLPETLADIQEINSHPGNIGIYKSLENINNATVLFSYIGSDNIRYYVYLTRPSE